MNHPLLRWTLALSLASMVAAGCSTTHGAGSPDMETRTYHLRYPDRDAEMVTRILDREYKRSGVRSASTITPSGDVIVQTSPQGHAALRRALAVEGR